jgi:hypothetical protein
MEHLTAVPDDVLDTDEVRSFTADELHELHRRYDGDDQRELLLFLLVEMREMRVLLTEFAQLGAAVAQLGQSGGMMAKLLGFGSG